ncbi:hypothetical protein [Campylobacter sp.]|uniref:hypothetical protein n=1 Tax=Campylobacter sp. TaxID=205 RepID=UPI002A74A7F8|nr:hypothetical protein [Campylobacter sp.]MDY2763049.1 hypothetical protein [Campylobacter sp.]
MKNFILDKIFVTSSQPVLFGNLLEANALFNEGMLVDPAKLNFRFNYFWLYLIYGVLCVVLLTLGILVLHSSFKNIDLHFSIISTMLITSAVFVGFDVFKRWARKEISAKRIRQAWELHFAFFEYEKYSKIIENIYNEALKEKISSSELEKFVLEKVVNNK